MTGRESALRMLIRINEEGVLCHEALRASEEDELPPKERALATRLVHGTLEREITIDRILELRTGRPVSKIKPKLRNLMRMSVYQLLFLTQIPASAVCNEAVKLAKQFGYAGLSGFVNGVLRNIARDCEAAGGREEYLSQTEKSLPEKERFSFRYAVPSGLADYYLRNYPEEAEGMFAAFLCDGVTSIRLNRSKGTMEELKRSLLEENTEYTEGLLPNTLRLGKNGNPGSLQAFRKGLFSIQDESSALAGNILPLRAGMRVLDLCAAPGGKTSHVADELKALGGGTVLSRDISEKKLEKIKEHIVLLGLDNVTVEAGDASAYEERFAEGFDLVLADLPCSGLGVIGRKPDIKQKTGTDDIQALAKLQRSILTQAVRYIGSGGYLCFSTCTVTLEENDRNCEFLLQSGMKPVDFSEKLPEQLKKRYRNGMLQLFPQDGTDGFFIALFQKE